MLAPHLAFHLRTGEVLTATLAKNLCLAPVLAPRFAVFCLPIEVYFVLRLWRDFLRDPVWTGVAGVISILMLLLALYPRSDHEVKEADGPFKPPSGSAATALVNDSLRIPEIEQAAAAWQAKRDGASAQRAIAAYEAAKTIDRAGFTPVQSEAFQRLEAAYRIVTKKAGGPWGGGRDQVPIHVTVTGAGADPAAVVFTQKLRANGFRVVDSRDAAELIADLTGSLRRLGPAPFGDNLQSGVAEVALHAHWAYDDADFLETRHRGSGAGSAAEIAATDAYRNAADLVFADFLASVPPAEF